MHQIPKSWELLTLLSDEADIFIKITNKHNHPTKQKAYPNILFYIHLNTWFFKLKCNLNQKCSDSLPGVKTNDNWPFSNIWLRRSVGMYLSIYKSLFCDLFNCSSPAGINRSVLGKNCAFCLGYRRRLRAVHKTDGTVFPNRDRPWLVNNIFIFF